MLPNWTFELGGPRRLRGAGWLGLPASSVLGVLPRDLARPAWPNFASTLPIWTYPAESSWDMCGAGWVDLAAPSDLGDLPSDLVRPAWPNLALTGSIWVPWALMVSSIWLPWLLPDALAGSIWVPTKAPTLIFSIACFVHAITFCLRRILMHRL